MNSMPGMDYSEYIAGEEDAGNRIDSFLADKLPLLSRSYIQKQIKEGNILVNGSRTKAGYKICASDTIKVYEAPAEELEIKPENIPLDIIYEDNDIIVINKPKRMVVHPAPGHYSVTVVYALLYHCRDSVSGINGIMRPGILNMIDQDTTGAIVACKNDTAHRSLAGQLKEHSITRTYHAIVNNHTKEEEGTIKTTVGRHPVDRKKMAVNVKGGRDAVTHYKVLDYLDNRHTYIACNLETGRTHQIRVHMAYIGNPVLGDSLYGPAKCPFKLEGQALHAKTLGFIHPSTGKYMEFEAPLPDYFKKLLGILSHK